MKKITARIFKKSLALMLTAALLLSAVISAVTVSATNTVIFPANDKYVTFENGGQLPSNVTIGGTASLVQPEINMPMGYGEYAIKKEYTDAPEVFLTLSGVETVIGHTYTVSGYRYFIDPGDAAEYPLVEIMDGSTVLCFSKYDTTYGKWTGFTTTFTATKESYDLGLRGKQCSGYIDNIAIYDITAPTEDIYVATDFSNMESLDQLPVATGIFSSMHFENDAEKGTIAVFNVAAGINVTNRFYVPKELEFGKKYTITMEYKSDKDMVMVKEDNNNNGFWWSVSADKWTTATKTITVDEATEKYFGLTATTAFNLQISSIYIKEVNVSAANTSDKQVYDYDNVLTTHAGGATTTIELVKGKNGDLTNAEALIYPTSSKREYRFDLDAPLTHGQKYRLSFDYKGKSVMKLHTTTTASGWTNPQALIATGTQDKGYEAAHSFLWNNFYGFNSDTWKTFSTTFTVKNAASLDADGLWFVAEYYYDSTTNATYDPKDYPYSTYITPGSTLYIDNLTLERIPSYGMAVTAGINGTGEVSNPIAEKGATVDFTATPNAGYAFKHWVDANGNTVSTANPYKHTVTADTILTPVFETFKKIRYDFEDGVTPAGVTGSSCTVSASPDSTYGNYGLYVPASGYDTVYFKNVKLLAGHTYFFSYRVYNTAPNNAYYRTDLYHADGTFEINKWASNTPKTAEGTNKWYTFGGYITATADGDYIALLNGDKIYLDNVTIVDITNGGEIYEDFSGENDYSDILERNSMGLVEYVNDPELNKTVAKITFTMNHGSFQYIPFPITLEAGVSYRVRFTYKMESGWGVAPSFNRKDLIGKDAFSQKKWSTGTTYVTGSVTNNSLVLGAISGWFDKEADGTTKPLVFYISEIDIDIQKSLGDLNNDGQIIGEDLVLLRKLILGTTTEDMFTTAGDVKADGAINIFDLIRLKKQLLSEAVVDNASTLSVVNSYNNVELEYSSSSTQKLGDGTRIINSVSDNNGYVIYKLDTGITEAAVQYDIPQSNTGVFSFEVSVDGEAWEPVTAQDVASEMINGLSWVRYTEYFNLKNSTYFKIILPACPAQSSSAGIRHVQLNHISEADLAAMYGANTEIRQAKTIFVDSVNGSDTNNGTTELTAVKTLQKALSGVIVPGDKILLAKGGTYSGGVKLYTSGTADKPITISSYGEGANPVINNFTNGTGITVLGEYVDISELDFTCKDGLNGVNIISSKGGVTKGITVRNCDFYEINSNENNNLSREVGAVHFKAYGNRPTWFDGITVDNNYINKVARTGIFVSSFWVARDTTQNWGHHNLKLEGKPVFFSKNVVISNNKIENSGGDGITLIGTEYALITRNTVANSKLINENSTDIAFAAVWCICSDNCVFRYNEVYGTSGANGGHDLQAFDIDISCNDCVVEYNYSHDNEGGFMLLCAADKATGGEVSRSIVRNNISVNDATSTEVNAYAGGVFEITGSVMDSQIYNNTIYLKNGVKLANFVNYGKATVLSKGNVFTNNIFSAPTGSTIVYGYTAFTDAKFDNNVFNNVATPLDSKISVVNSLMTNPNFANAGYEGTNNVNVKNNDVMSSINAAFAAYNTSLLGKGAKYSN